MAGELQQSLEWPYVVKGNGTHLIENYRKKATPTLLSLDGGGMRGVISAQILIQLEDSIKQVLWKQRLIKEDVVKDLLNHAAGRGTITVQQKDDLLQKYKEQPPPPEKPKMDDGEPNNISFEKLWRSYCDAQKQLLEEPVGWDDVRKCFDIDIGDYFEQLAGTSTGGLLALYLASRGGVLAANAKKEGLKLKSRPGSAKGVRDFYMDNGETIFDTDWKRKMWRFLSSSGRYQHDAEGLEKVLQKVFGELTLQDLEEYSANVLVTTVDVAQARSGFFIHTSAKEPPLFVGQPPKDSGTSAFATTLRKADYGKLVFVRDPDVISDDPAAHPIAQSVGWLNPKFNYGEDPLPADKDPKQATNRNQIKFLTAITGWTAPIHLEKLNFKLRDVGRATSAAPSFLPPKQVKPVTEGSTPEDWANRLFLDGGMANNDPVYLGLQAMMQRNNKARLQDCAILSIGTGTRAAVSGYSPEAPTNWFSGFFSGAANTFNVAKTMTNIGNLVGLTMNLNGEDKENILHLIFYGLLRMPAGTYLRIQLKDEESDYKNIPPKRSDIDELPYNLKEEVQKQWRDALNVMDDPRPDVLQAYQEMGKILARRSALRLVWWVRCFIFGLETAAKFPFVQELSNLAETDSVQGGKFVAAVTAEENPTVQCFSL